MSSTVAEAENTAPDAGRYFPDEDITQQEWTRLERFGRLSSALYRKLTMYEEMFRDMALRYFALPSQIRAIYFAGEYAAVKNLFVGVETRDVLFGHENANWMNTDAHHPIPDIAAARDRRESLRSAVSRRDVVAARSHYYALHELVDRLEQNVDNNNGQLNAVEAQFASDRPPGIPFPGLPDFPGEAKWDDSYVQRFGDIRTFLELRNFIMALPDVKAMVELEDMPRGDAFLLALRTDDEAFTNDQGVETEYATDDINEYLEEHEPKAYYYVFNRNLTPEAARQIVRDNQIIETRVNALPGAWNFR